MHREKLAERLIGHGPLAGHHVFGHRPGQATRAALRRMTALSDADISGLEAEGVLRCDPHGRASEANTDQPHFFQRTSPP